MALLSILFDTGCRASEICNLTMDNVTFTPETAWILVHGKGRKQREVALGKKARLALWRYIHRERKSDDPHVFIGRKGPLTAEGLDRMLYRLRDRVGRENFPDITTAAHRWRHSGAVESLTHGMDLYALMRKYGHADITTTTGYLKAMTQQQLRSLSVSPLDNL
jgi:site-specific recombinase XerD